MVDSPSSPDGRTHAAAVPVDVGVRILETMRVILVTGVLYGVLVAGVGSRLAMLLLRVTSSRDVIGMQSDDGFEIGRFTLGGTYNLLLLGAMFGIIGVGVFLLVAPRLIGPSWFRQLTVGAACAAVVGSMLVHADGVDFTRLTPTWLAVGLFVALPGVFGAFIGPAVNAVRTPGSWTTRGRRRIALPIVAVACFPLALFSAVATAFVVTILTVVGMHRRLAEIRRTTWFTLFTRCAWLTIAAAGLVALINDIRSLA